MSLLQIKLKQPSSDIIIKQMPKIIDILYVSVTDELMERPLLSLEHEIQKSLKEGFTIKGDVMIKVHRSGIKQYIQHLVKYDSN
jgi:hypothetical protein